MIHARIVQRGSFRPFLIVRAKTAVLGHHIKRAQIYALMTAIRDAGRIYSLADRKTSGRIDLGGCAADVWSTTIDHAVIRGLVTALFPAPVREIHMAARRCITSCTAIMIAALLVISLSRGDLSRKTRPLAAGFAKVGG